MERAAVPYQMPAGVVFRDGLGERRRVSDPTGSGALELLCLRGELAAVPSFEFALRERVSHLTGFRHPDFGRVRGVERMTDREATLAVVSDSTPGTRLSELLVNAEERRLGLDINTALCLIRQLVPAVATLHESTREVAHGAIGPDRIIVTPNARLVIVEYVLGAALEQLRYSPERYWTDLRIALPRTAGPARFDQRADVTQIGVVALSLILGRPLRDDEYPGRVADVVASTWAVSARGGFEPLPPGLRGWLGRALQLDTRNAFASAVEARVELDKVIGDGEYMASPASLESFLSKYHAAEQRSASTGSPVAARPAYAPQVVKPGPTPVPLVKPGITAAPLVKPRPTPEAIVLEPLVPNSAVPNAAAPGSPVSVPAMSRQAPSPKPNTPAKTQIDIRELLASPPPPSIPPSAHKPSASEPPPMAAASSADATVKPWSFDDSPAIRSDVPVLDRSSRREPEAAVFENPAEVPAKARPWKKLAIAALLLAGLAGGGVMAARQFRSVPAAAVETGTLVVTTNPAGAEVVVDGQPRGVTPLTLTLSPGAHNVDLRMGSSARSVPVTITAGKEVAQYIELPAMGSTTGQLQVRTDPPGAKVTVDGVPVGVSPMMVVDLAPGEHTVALDSGLGAVKQTVMIEAGVTSSLLVPLKAAEGAPVSGWISMNSPVEMQLFENDQLIGTTRSERIMVSAGRHEIQIVNDAIGYRATRVLQVQPGRTVPVTIDVPKGMIALNALPWAEVWIDGEKIGETPIGNLSVPLGPRNVLFRHPEFGERHHTVVVTLKDVARLSVDMRKK